MVVSIDSGLFRLISVDESLMKRLPQTLCNKKKKKFLFLQLSHRECEVGVGEWFVGEGEMPPFCSDRLETVT